MTLREEALQKIRDAQAAVEEAQTAVGKILSSPPHWKRSKRIRQDFSDARVSMSLVYSAVWKGI